MPWREGVSLPWHLSCRELELSVRWKGGLGQGGDICVLLQVTHSVRLSGQREHELWVRDSTPLWPCCVALDLSLASVSSIP